MNITPLTDSDQSAIYVGLMLATQDCFGAAYRRGWWHDIETGKCLVGDMGKVGWQLTLIHTEISEAAEGKRKNLMDDKLPHRKMMEVELADALIRIFDLAGAEQLDLAGAYAEKRRYNEQRKDHTPEARRAAGGKTY